ncbi:MAG: hypothetical protein KJZ80_16130 [Hyphomicrobiaceae bacterium]|nr:hypothetical protein [Hyphomicrobiaceae bacterium]
MTNMLPTPSDAMLEDMRRAFDLVFSPAGAQALESELAAALTADVESMGALARLLTLAHTALAVADLKELDDVETCGVEMCGSPASWYRDVAQSLLRRVVDAVEALGQKMRGPAARLN